jgi:hypothetical protein
MLGLLLFAGLLQTAPPSSWYFAVSGDSRDCGGVVMPRIASAIAARRGEAPAEFFWHLGDFRRTSDLDCDVAMRLAPAFDCKERRPELLPRDAMGTYLDGQWDDFLERQVKPFGDLPVFLTPGNHELYAQKTRDEYRQKFRRFLTQEPIHRQRLADRKNGVGGVEGETYYRFQRGGVDFLVLDNADGVFSKEEMLWVTRVLAADARDPAITTIVAGMHAALPFSIERRHAMDDSCAGFCSGEHVYDLLLRASRGALVAGGKPKKVTLFASHAHTFEADAYDTPEHAGQVLSGWIVGTAGAEQYRTPLRYGYLEVEVNAGGDLVPRFREVTRATRGPEGESGALLDYCFERNLEEPPAPKAVVDCACGAAS